MKRKARKSKRQLEDAVVKRMTKIRLLLREFGATLSGYDPGVTAYLKLGGQRIGWAGEQLDFTHTEWQWLEPLLIELKATRLAARRRGRG